MGIPMYRVIGPSVATSALGGRVRDGRASNNLCRLLRKTAGGEPMHSDALSTEFCSPRKSDGSGNRQGADVRRFAESVIGANGERWLATERFIDPRILLCAKPGRTTARHGGFHAIRLAYARKLRRSAGNADHDQPRAPAS